MLFSYKYAVTLAAFLHVDLVDQLVEMMLGFKASNKIYQNSWQQLNDIKFQDPSDIYLHVVNT